LATLKDLSRELGLSVTQVSRALNGHSDVNEATRDRVRQMAQQLNYQPNLSARKLATGRSGTVGLVVSAPSHPAGNPLFVQMISGLSANFSRRDIRFLLHITSETDDLLDVHRRLVDSASLDGFVVVDTRLNDPRVSFLKRRGIPFVVHGRTDTATDYPFFDIDNYGVGYKLTRYLTQLGHRRIAFLNGIADRSYCAARLRGYVDALAEAGLAFDPHLHRNDRMERGVGLIETVRMMEDPVRRPTAFIAGNTMMAQGIYEALGALSLSVPEDVSVVAHDDMLPDLDTAAMHPALTVTESPLHLSWEPLARLLVEALEGQELSKLQVAVDVAFHQRQSAAPPRKP
jgi:LacI family transcriptional regulator